MKNGALCHFQRNRIWDIKKVKHDLMLSAVIALVLEASIKFFIFMKLLTAYFTIRRWIRAIFWLQVREQLERYKKSMFLGELSRSKLSIQFSSVAQSCPTFCDLMGGSTPGLPVRHQLSEFTQTRVHWVGDAIQTSHALSSTYAPAFNPSQHQGLFKWVSSLHQVVKVLEFQLPHQSFQWTSRTDLL